jgi:ParB-like chromosome segregation protein Spo0J
VSKSGSGSVGKLEQVPTSDLIPYARNARTHSDAQVAQIAGSIQEFGFCNPVLIDKANGIIAGHGRVRAADLLKLQTVPCIRLDHLTDAQKRAYILADNRIALSSGWDEAMLANELQDLHADEIDLGLTGFDADELGKLLGLDTLGDEQNGEVVEDEVPEPPADPITKPGNLWILGEHRLLCGDSTNAEDVARLMAGAKADLCFTSPPYNSKDGGYKTDYSGKTKKFYNHQCDDRTEDEWVEFCNNVLSIASSHLESEDSPVIWNVMYTANCRSGYGRTMFAGPHGLSVKETICWDKGAGFPTASRGILSRNWELVFVLSKGDKYTTTQGENEPRWAKWNIPRPKQQEEHKATFPVDLAARAMCDFGAKGDSVYEPFCGSGTTLIAAEQLGRRCYGMEISPQYCDVIVKRWETLTGKTATLEAHHDRNHTAD